MRPKLHSSRDRRPEGTSRGCMQGVEDQRIPGLPKFHRIAVITVERAFGDTSSSKVSNSQIPYKY
jgi:hypothetical protein